MKRILIITTGGTLEMERDGNNQLKTNNNAENQLIGCFDAFKSTCNISIINAFSIDSSNMTPKHWMKLADIIESNRSEFDGFVITHGTDTLSFTSAALSFVGGDFSKPIAITGAQVPCNCLGTDTQMNLSNAIEIILSGKIKGVFSVFGSQVLTGTRIKKLSEFEYNAFFSLNSEPLAEIGAYVKYNIDAISKHNAAYKNRKFINAFNMENVAVINLNPGLNQNLIKSGVENGYIKALIIRSYADGNTNTDELISMYEYLQTSKIPVCHISQPDKGTTTMNTYEAGIKAKSWGVIPAFDMTTEGLSVKFGWLLAQNLSYDDFRKALLTNYCGEIFSPEETNKFSFWDKHTEVKKNIVFAE